MAETDDPGGTPAPEPAPGPAPAPVPAPPPPAAPEPYSRMGALMGAVVILIALGAAVAFGLSRTDDPGRVAIAVVDVHDDGPTSGPSGQLPDAGVDPGFSTWARRAGWTPVGARIDQVEGRTLTTAFWERSGRRIAHTVVSGDPVDAPAGARRTGRRGVLLQSFDHAGRTAVIWTEGDHTAVISAIGISRAALYALAGGPKPAPRSP